MMDEEIRQAISEVREMKQMCGNINMKLTNIVTQRGQDRKKKLEAEYQRGFEDGKKEAESSEAIERAKADAFNKGMLYKEEKISEAYQRGLEDAWEAARKIADMWTRIDNDELLAIFGITERIGYSTINSLFGKQTANEAMLNLEAYEEKQEAADKIEVGDEVEVLNSGNKYLIAWFAGTSLCGFAHDGVTCRLQPSDVRKTGRHFDIQSILEAMKHD